MPCDPTIPVIRIYPREMKIYICTKPCMQMFIAALFTSPDLETTQCPYTGEWINNLGILLSNKKEQTIDTRNSTDESQKHYSK